MPTSNFVTYFNVEIGAQEKKKSVSKSITFNLCRGKWVQKWGFVTKMCHMGSKKAKVCFQSLL